MGEERRVIKVALLQCKNQFLSDIKLRAEVGFGINVVC